MSEQPGTDTRTESQALGWDLLDAARLFVFIVLVALVVMGQ